MNNRTTIMIALLVIAMMVGAANATVTAIALTDGDDDTFFYGEEITLTWSSTNPQSSIWINSTGTSWGSAFDDNTSMRDDKNGVTLVHQEVSGSGGAPFTYTYTFANYTVNESAQAWVVYIDDTGTATMPGTCANESFVMNSYNVSLQTGRSAAEGNSTLAGDTIEVSVTTSGMLAKTERDGLGITITPLEGGNMVSGASNVAGTGNYTFNITAAKAGVGALKNVTLNYGGFSWNSTQLTTYSGWGSAANTQFNVSELNLKAYDISGTTTPDQYIASVNITTTLGGNKVTADIAYPINITLTHDQSNLLLGTSPLQGTTMNLTVPAGLNEGNDAYGDPYGNYTLPVDGELTSEVTSETSGTITATVNTSGEAWTDGFVIHPSGDFNVLTAPSAATSYQIGKLVNITGWNSTGFAPMLNITDPTGALINSIVVVLNPTDHSFEYTWDTNRMWNTMQTTTWNAILNKTGVYKLALGNGTTAYIDTVTITLNEDITAAPNTTSIPVNGSLWINGTTDRWNSNGTFMNCTISTASNKGGSIINNSTSDVITDFSAATGLATYNISWDSSANLAAIVAAAAPVSSDTFDETYYITVNDSAAKEIAATFQITDSITVNPATGIPGRNFMVTGTSPRENGTIITVNVYSSGFPGAPATNNSTAIVFGNEWNATMDASYKEGGAPLSALYTYTIVADDSIVKDSADLTLGTGSISLESLPDTTMDGIVWFNGTTDLGSGTVIQFNVTNAIGLLFNRSSKTVVGTTFNLSWQVNTSLITGNFTAPVEQCNVKAYNGTIYSTTKTLNVREDLVITTPDFEIAPSGEFKIEGTLNRVNTTVLTVKTSRAGVTTDSSSATVYGGQFNVTREAINTAGSNEPLPAGEYTITVKDGTNASASITMTVAAAKVTLDNPVDGASYNVNDTVSIDGTSNIGNNTKISVMIQRTSGPEGWTPFTTTLYGTTDFTGHWSTEWNTSADSTFQALSTTSGNYRFWAQNGTYYSLMPVITIAAVLTVDTIVVDPAGPVSLPNVSDTQQFNATCYNDTTELTGITVTWNSDNTTVGTIDASGLFTAAANGTTNVTATAQGVISDLVSVTVGEAGVPGDINGNGAVTLADAIYLAKNVAGMSGYETLSADGDINASGAVTLADAIYLAKHVAGMSGYETLY